ncbi:MAG: putative lipid II flippase FtsW [Natronospirillum sp.]|uniref:putative lipid II flippase FtsW n=1 Tax=Natronospirillum sp. TaxID=2812955 RepID=UPI0025FE12AD|nr:putative lipid II flippase FtsW [Natronospirillum sp.]MCH8551334.1 putative lipid II flippase FtsW [Natronospirillum sp.]
MNLSLSLRKHLDGDRSLWSRIDQPLVILTFGLALFGWMMITSASMDFAAQVHGDSFALMIRHGVYLAMGAVTFALMVHLPLAFWYRISGLLLLFGLVSLVLVLIPGIGREINGSWRWIHLGVITIQPSEAMKVAMVIYVAGYLVRRQDEVRTSWAGFLKPLMVVALVTSLLLAQPDFGAVIILMATIMGMMFMGGVRPGQFFVTIAVAIMSAGLMAVTQTYRVQRLLSFMDPWAEGNVYGSGYQLTQALIAFGRGEWFGVGLGNSLQKLFYLPEAHTDFITAIIAEEFGLFGMVLLLLVLSALVGRMLWIGWRADRSGHPFSAYLCYGVVIIFALQIFINIGVNTGLLPTKGLTLPFISYGGSSLLTCFAMVGLVSRVSLELHSETSAEPLVKGVDA